MQSNDDVIAIVSVAIFNLAHLVHLFGFELNYIPFESIPSIVQTLFLVTPC